ncbi:MAG: hypothetical protein V1659_02675 [Candidatus Woesearchaeota archaeon]
MVSKKKIITGAVLVAAAAAAVVAARAIHKKGYDKQAIAKIKKAAKDLQVGVVSIEKKIAADLKKDSCKSCSTAKKKTAKKKR